jgi:hypothetical protein
VPTACGKSLEPSPRRALAPSVSWTRRNLKFPRRYFNLGAELNILFLTHCKDYPVSARSGSRISLLQKKMHILVMVHPSSFYLLSPGFVSSLLISHIRQVVNDDGPPSQQSSPYVHSVSSLLPSSNALASDHCPQLVHNLQSAGHLVSVVLPNVQRSWIGKAHMVGATVTPSYFRPGTLHEDDGTVHEQPLPSHSEEEEWILVDGTPASCVQIGLFHVFQDRGKVDLVMYEHARKNTTGSCS